jgi:hypothetical protein
MQLCISTQNNMFYFLMTFAASRRLTFFMAHLVKYSHTYTFGIKMEFFIFTEKVSDNYEVYISS